MLDISPVGCPFIPGSLQETFPNSQLATQFPTSSRNLLHTAWSHLGHLCSKLRYNVQNLEESACYVIYYTKSRCSLIMSIAWKLMKSKENSKSQLATRSNTQCHFGHSCSKFAQNPLKSQEICKSQLAAQCTTLKIQVSFGEYRSLLQRQCTALHTVTVVTCVANCVEVLQKIEKK